MLRLLQAERLRIFLFNISCFASTQGIFLRTYYWDIEVHKEGEEKRIFHSAGFEPTTSLSPGVQSCAPSQLSISNLSGKLEAEKLLFEKKEQVTFSEEIVTEKSFKGRTSITPQPRCLWHKLSALNSTTKKFHTMLRLL